MFSAIKRIGSRKVSVRTAALVIAFVLFAVTAMAARYESLTVGTLKVDKIERLSENAPLDITIDGAWTETMGAIPYTAGTGFVLEDAEGSFYTFDVTSVDDSNLSSTGSSGALVSGTAGVTLILPVPTADNHGRVYPIQKIDSGTTLVPLHCPASGATMSSQGLPINSTTGVTDTSMDAVGDIMYLMPNYNGAVSWWVVNRYIH
jgi:hypothetical protein